jgi:hypothetical protein
MSSHKRSSQWWEEDEMKKMWKEKLGEKLEAENRTRSIIGWLSSDEYNCIGTRSGARAKRNLRWKERNAEEINRKTRKKSKAYALRRWMKWEYDRMGKKVIKQLTSIEYSLVFSRPYDGQVHVLSLERVNKQE